MPKLLRLLSPSQRRATRRIKRLRALIEYRHVPAIQATIMQEYGVRALNKIK